MNETEDNKNCGNCIFSRKIINFICDNPESPLYKLILDLTGCCEVHTAMQRFQDVDGREIENGMHIEALDSEWMDGHLFGKVVKIRDYKHPEHDGELGVHMNHGFTVPLMDEHKVKIIDDYKNYFIERYKKIHGYDDELKIIQAMKNPEDYEFIMSHKRSKSDGEYKTVKIKGYWRKRRNSNV